MNKVTGKGDLFEVSLRLVQPAGLAAPAPVQRDNGTLAGRDNRGGKLTYHIKGGGLSRSALFTAFNCAKRLPVDRGRLNRALGLAQSKAPIGYGATADECDCPDSRYSGWTCKHRLASVLVAMAVQA